MTSNNTNTANTFLVSVRFERGGGFCHLSDEEPSTMEEALKMIDITPEKGVVTVSFTNGGYVIRHWVITDEYVFAAKKAAILSTMKALQERNNKGVYQVDPEDDDYEPSRKLNLELSYLIQEISKL